MKRLSIRYARMISSDQFLEEFRAAVEADLQHPGAEVQWITSPTRLIAIVTWHEKEAQGSLNLHDEHGAAAPGTVETKPYEPRPLEEYVRPEDLRKPTGSWP